jgi:hypothetical protein
MPSTVRGSIETFLETPPSPTVDDEVEKKIVANSEEL